MYFVYFLGYIPEGIGIHRITWAVALPSVPIPAVAEIHALSAANDLIYLTIMPSGENETIQEGINVYKNVNSRVYSYVSGWAIKSTNLDAIV